MYRRRDGVPLSKILEGSFSPNLHSAHLKSLTVPIRLSCTHAHVVNKMADVVTT